MNSGKEKFLKWVAEKKLRAGSGSHRHCRFFKNFKKKYCEGENRLFGFEHFIFLNNKIVP